MKNRFLFLFTLLLVLVLIAACQEPAGTETAPQDGTSSDTVPQSGAPSDTPTDDPANSVYADKSAAELLELLRPSVEAEELTVLIDPVNLRDKDLFNYHFFVNPSKNVTEAAICQPINGVTPFFLGILKVDSAKAAETLAKNIKENINYQKLICTVFEKAHVDVKGSTVILIMDGDAPRADRMLARWEALAEK